MRSSGSSRRVWVTPGTRARWSIFYAIDFDPVFRTEDFASYVHESMPAEILEAMDLKRQVMEQAANPLTRLAAAWWLRNKDPQAIARFIHSHRPKDAAEQWEKVAGADGLAFISPVFWLHFPAIMKGWFERVFAYGDAYALTTQGWNGDMKAGCRCCTMKRRWSSVPLSSRRKTTNSSCRNP